MNVLVFDIETVPDVEGGRRLYSLAGMGDKEVANILYHKRRQETGDSEFLRLHLHRIVAISAVLRRADSFRVWSLGDIDADEAELIRRFYDGIARFTPTLVSWNGGGFDLPVLHYRALLHGIQAPEYWETGDNEREFRYNNYLNRFHERHTDLMDVLAGYQPRANAPLHEIATLLGFPGKMGMDGSRVWERYQAGDLEGIRNYCETDVLNTYLLYLRYELMRGNLTGKEYGEECQRVRDEISSLNAPHWNEFLAAWDKSKA